MIPDTCIEAMNSFEYSAPSVNHVKESPLTSAVNTLSSCNEILQLELIRKFRVVDGGDPRHNDEMMTF